MSNKKAKGARTPHEVMTNSLTRDQGDDDLRKSMPEMYFLNNDKHHKMDPQRSKEKGYIYRYEMPAEVWQNVKLQEMFVMNTTY